MTYYNPLVRAEYEHTHRHFVKLYHRVHASYGIVYRYFIDSASVSHLEPVGFANEIQRLNLEYIDKKLPMILAEYVRDAWLGYVQTPEDYIYRKKDGAQSDIEDDLLYYSSILKDFVECLFYSDIAQNHRWYGLKNLNKSYFRCTKGHPHQYDTLYDRLKLRDFLMTHLYIVADKRKCHWNGNELTVWMKFKVR